MTVAHTLVLAGKYLRGHFRRYVFLLAVLCVSFAVITTITSLIEGMSDSVFQASENHYGGHVIVRGNDHDSNDLIRITETDRILEAANAADLDPDRVVRRTISSDGVIHFAGKGVRQKYVYGIDWEAERMDFARLAFAEGGADMKDLGNGIFISSAVARELHARPGDDVILELLTRTRQKNTGTFVVRGIIQDPSIFGYYKCIVDRRILNSLMSYNEDDCSSVGFFFNDRLHLDEKAHLLYAQLAARIQMRPEMHDRDDFSKFTSSWEGIIHIAVPIQIYISQISDLLTAMQLVSYFLYVMMIAIALVSMSVTYRLILHERSREIGTIRVLGLQGAGTQAVLVLECLMVFLLAICAGFALSGLLIWILSLFSYSWIPGFDIFLQKGRLTASFPVSLILTNILILVATTLPAVWIPAFRASRMDLVTALSGGNK